MRQILLGNIVLTGGGTLFAGFNERLTNELTAHFPNVGQPSTRKWNSLIFFNAQVKIHAPGNPIERRYGGWLGGSVLASLGTFHQLWISKEEWQVGLAALHHIYMITDLFTGTRQTHRWAEVQIKHLICWDVVCLASDVSIN
jgi:actin-related protein